jgi:hypothetical protein
MWGDFFPFGQLFENCCGCPNFGLIFLRKSYVLTLAKTILITYILSVYFANSLGHSGRQAVMAVIKTLKNVFGRHGSKIGRIFAALANLNLGYFYKISPWTSMHVVYLSVDEVVSLVTGKEVIQQNCRPASVLAQPHLGSML